MEIHIAIFIIPNWNAILDEMEYAGIGLVFICYWIGIYMLVDVALVLVFKLS